MSRKEPTRWEKDRGIYLKLGFVLSLSMVILAFNYTVDPKVYITSAMSVYHDDEVEVIRTAEQKPPTPPPVPSPVDDLVTEPQAEPIDPIRPIPVLPRDPAVNPGPVSVPDPVVPPRPLPPTVEPEDNGPLLVVEVMPRFPGCEDQNMKRKEKEECAVAELLKFMKREVKYPPTAREVGITGTVVVQFIVEKDGSITDAKVIKDIGGGCGREALRVVKDKMPAWIPGIQQGRPVRVQFSLPVRFELGR